MKAGSVQPLAGPLGVEAVTASTGAASPRQEPGRRPMLHGRTGSEPILTGMPPLRSRPIPAPSLRPTTVPEPGGLLDAPGARCGDDLRERSEGEADACQ